MIYFRVVSSGIAMNGYYCKVVDKFTILIHDHDPDPEFSFPFLTLEIADEI